jgi:hypothetical protein
MCPKSGAASDAALVAAKRYRLGPHGTRGHNKAFETARRHDGYRRGLLSPFAGGGASGLKSAVRGCFLGLENIDAASNRASAARSGSSRGACGYRSPSMTPRMAAIAAASSSSGRSIVGTAAVLLRVIPCGSSCSGLVNARPTPRQAGRWAPSRQARPLRPSPLNKAAERVACGPPGGSAAASTRK